MSKPLNGHQFDLRGGILFYGLDGLLYVARYDVSYPNEWEVFEASGGIRSRRATATAIKEALATLYRRPAKRGRLQ